MAHRFSIHYTPTTKRTPKEYHFVVVYFYDLQHVIVNLCFTRAFTYNNILPVFLHFERVGSGVDNINQSNHRVWEFSSVYMNEKKSYELPQYVVKFHNFA